MPDPTRFSPLALFNGSNRPTPEVAHRRFWFRVSDTPTEMEKLISQTYSRVGCPLVYTHANAMWSNLRGNLDNDIIEGEVSQGPSDSGVLSDMEFESSHPIYSFSANTICDARAMQHCSAIEWLLIPADASRALSTLSPLVMNLPIDVVNLKRLQQRIKILRNGVHEEAKVGVGTTLTALLENMNVISELDIDYVTAIAPICLLSESHPAYTWINEPVVELVQRLNQTRKALGREDIAIALQAPLRSGYDAAAYINMGVDTIILNGWDCVAGIKNATSPSDAFSASFLGVSAQQHLMASNQRLIEERIQHFFEEVKDYQTYVGA